MATLGDILREARLKKKVSVSDAAKATRIKIQILEGLESDDYTFIPAPIYGRGFVKMYAEFLHLDPAEMVEEYNAIVSGDEAEAAPKKRRIWERRKPQLAQVVKVDQPTPEPEVKTKPIEMPKQNATAVPAEPESEGAAARPDGLEGLVGQIQDDPLKWGLSGIGILIVLVFVISGMSQCLRRVSAGDSDGRSSPELERLHYSPSEPYLDNTQ